MGGLREPAEHAEPLEAQMPKSRAAKSVMLSVPATVKLMVFAKRLRPAKLTSSISIHGQAFNQRLKGRSFENRSGSKSFDRINQPRCRPCFLFQPFFHFHDLRRRIWDPAKVGT